MDLFRLAAALLVGGFAFAALVHYRDVIADAIRRGPWGGGGPPGVGPAPAADPFARSRFQNQSGASG